MYSVPPSLPAGFVYGIPHRAGVFPFSGFRGCYFLSRMIFLFFLKFSHDLFPLSFFLSHLPVCRELGPH